MNQAYQRFRRSWSLSGRQNVVTPKESSRSPGPSAQPISLAGVTLFRSAAEDRLVVLEQQQINFVDVVNAVHDALFHDEVEGAAGGEGIIWLIIGIIMLFFRKTRRAATIMLISTAAVLLFGELF